MTADKPTPDQIRQARKASGLTQTEAGALVCGSYRGWQEWEHGKAGMPAGLYELFNLKVSLGLGPSGTASPTPQQVRAARLGLGLTQAQCAALVGVAQRSWQNYETRTKNARAMPPGLWDLFRLKTALG